MHQILGHAYQTTGNTVLFCLCAQGSANQIVVAAAASRNPWKLAVFEISSSFFIFDWNWPTGSYISREGNDMQTDSRIADFFGSQTKRSPIKVSHILFLSNAILLVHNFEVERLNSSAFCHVLCCICFSLQCRHEHCSSADSHSSLIEVLTWYRLFIHKFGNFIKVIKYMLALNNWVALLTPVADT